MTARRVRLVFLTCVSVIAAATASGLSVVGSADASAGLLLDVQVDSEAWLKSLPLSVCADGQIIEGPDLLSVGTSKHTGVDGFGEFEAQLFKVRTGDDLLRLGISVRRYRTLPQAAVLALTVESNISTCQAVGGLATNFPGFSTTKGRADSLIGISWEGAAASRVKYGVGLDKVANNGVNAGPVVLYDKASERVLMWSTLDNHKIIGQFTNASAYAAGLSAKIASLSAGFAYSFVFWTGTGITQTVYEWGLAMQRFHGRQVHWGTDTWRNPSASLIKLGYFTDNGAYYYEWPPHVNASRPWSAEEGLVLVKESLAQQGVHIHYMQLDDWWYYGPFYFGNVKCVQKWEGDQTTMNPNTDAPALFPRGIPEFQRHLGIDLMLYTPFWCSDFETPFATKESSVMKGTKMVVPLQSRAFFDSVLDQGLNLSNGHFSDYEIDFLGNNFEGMLGTSIVVPGDAELWYSGMAEAAAARGISIQYCLAYPSDILISLLYPSVSNARASGDYCTPGPNTHDVGGSSLLMGALKMAPSKDVFWSKTKQPLTKCDQNRQYFMQPHPKLDVLLAAMSLGPVALGDALNYTDAALVHRTSMADGTLLRPDRPISRVDQTFWATGRLGEELDVRSSHSAIQLCNVGANCHAEVLAHYIFGFNLSRPVEIGRHDIYPSYETSIELAVYQDSPSAPGFGCDNGTASSCVTILSAGQLPILAPTEGLDEDFVFHVAVPKLANGWFFLGELEKYATVSRDRIKALHVMHDVSTHPALLVEIIGTPSETVRMVAIEGSSSNAAVHVASAGVSAEGKATLCFYASRQRFWI